MSAYQELTRRFARLSAIDNALGILHWDQETTMPEGASETRGEALATLSVLRHELLVDPRIGDWLDEAGSADDLDDWQRANVREMRRLWVHATAVPADLVEASSKAVSRCEIAWRAARRDNDFPGLLPLLEEVLRLQRETARAKAERLGVSPYDALLDYYEPGGRSERIDAIFEDLAGFLPDFIETALSHQAARPPIEPLSGPFPVEIQREIGIRFMAAAGFDFNRGRLDVSVHPFCGGAEDDVRITTRYDESDFTSALMGVLHETGHALYEQGRPAGWKGQPVGAARGMSLHESQSLIIEMQACRSRAFLEWAAPILREAFRGEGPAWSADNLYRHYTRVERGFIRVDADEATYPAHVILRYRLEKALIQGEMELADLPAAWNGLMEELLGVRPPTDTLGCLQDIHWPGGAWGYFPTYTLGAMTAAQLFDAACRADGDVLPGLSRGDFQPLTDWLREHIHSQGSRWSSEELLIRATGRPLDAEVFKHHLRTRYLDD